MIFFLLLFLVLVPFPALAEFELAVYGGGSFTNKTDITVSSVNATFSNLKLDDSATVGGKAGYWFPAFGNIVAYGLGVDVFYFRPNIPQQNVAVRVGNLQGSALFSPVNVRTLGIGLDLLKLRLELMKDEHFQEGRLQPYASVGPAIFMTEFEAGTKQDDTKLGLKAGAGVQFLLTQMLGLFAEYRFTHYAAEAQVAAPPLGSLTAEGDINTQHLVGGLALRF